MKTYYHLVCRNGQCILDTTNNYSRHMAKNEMRIKRPLYDKYKIISRRKYNKLKRKGVLVA